MRAAAYIRVSTQEQANEGYSIGAQTDRLKAYCSARDWILSGVYTDPGYSGAKLERPALQKLIDDIQKHKIDVVVVYKLDRLSRSQKDTLYLIEDVFLLNSVAFVSINENFDTSTAFGRAMVGILSVFAQLEREQIRERTMMGLLERAKDGYWRGGGNPPIGYKYDPSQGILVIDEYEALQIRKIFDLYVHEHLSTHRISKIMAAQYTHHYGSWIARTNIIGVLSNPTYTGKIPNKGQYFDGRHEPIIDTQTFAEAQRLLHLRSAERKPTDPHHTPFRASHLLTGIIWCGQCGARFYAVCAYRGSKKLPYRQRKKIHHYTCYSRTKARAEMVKDPNCKNQKWRVEDLDHEIIQEILKLQYDPNQLALAASKSQENAQAKAPSNDAAIHSQRLAVVEQQISKLLDLYQMQNIPFDQISERLETLTAEKNALVNLLEASHTEDPKALSLQNVQLLLSDADAVLQNGTLEERRFLVHSLINRITLTENDVQIEWSF